MTFHLLYFIIFITAYSQRCRALPQGSSLPIANTGPDYFTTIEEYQTHDVVEQEKDQGQSTKNAANRDEDSDRKLTNGFEPLNILKLPNSEVNIKKIANPFENIPLQNVPLSDANLNFQNKRLFGEKYEQANVGSLIDKIQSNVFDSIQQFNKQKPILQKDLADSHNLNSQITYPELFKLDESYDQFAVNQRHLNILPRSVSEYNFPKTVTAPIALTNDMASIHDKLFNLPNQAGHLDSIFKQDISAPSIFLLPHHFLPLLYHPKPRNPISLIEKPPITTFNFLPFKHNPLEVGISNLYDIEKKNPSDIFNIENVAKHKLNLAGISSLKTPGILSTLKKSPPLLTFKKTINPSVGFRSISTDIDNISPRVRAILQKVLNNLSVIQRSLEASIKNPTESQDNLKTEFKDLNLILENKNLIKDQLGLLDSLPKEQFERNTFSSNDLIKDLNDISTNIQIGNEAAHIPMAINTPLSLEQTNTLDTKTILKTQSNEEDSVSNLSEVVSKVTSDDLISELVPPVELIPIIKTITNTENSLPNLTSDEKYILDSDLKPHTDIDNDNDKSKPISNIDLTMISEPNENDFFIENIPSLPENKDVDTQITDTEVSK